MQTLHPYPPLPSAEYFSIHPRKLKLQQDQLDLGGEKWYDYGQLIYLTYKQIYWMKLRTQRVHHMGSSNRDLQSPTQDIKNVFQKSYIKSHSSYYKTSSSLPPADPRHEKTHDPFKGTHSEQQTLRWDAGGKKAGREQEWELAASAGRLDRSGELNREVRQLVGEFEGKDVNMFKLGELKRTFVKNNRKRRNLGGYFANFATDGHLGISAMQRIVGEYGYDVSEEEARLIFRLAGSKDDHITLDQFVELMTKENVHFRTLKLDGAFGRARTHFQQRIHLVFRNKFSQLREAFRIYRMRGEDIDRQKYDYVMRKLDINDLVVSQDERSELFQRFSDTEGNFNVERLLCAIVEQEQAKSPTFPPKLSNFEDNLMANEQKQASINGKNTYFDFKRLSNLQYESQLAKAREVMKELNKIPESVSIVSQGETVSKDTVRARVEALLQKHGVNCSKQEYDCFISSLDFNAHQHISCNQFKNFLQETSKHAEERFERRVRALPPQLQPLQSAHFDHSTALESLNKIKTAKFSPQMRVLFKEFDKDKDGFVSRQEFKEKIASYSILDNWELQNLTNYIDAEGKGYADFHTFASKFTEGDKEPQNPTEPIFKAKSHSNWASTKRSYIKDANAYSYNTPSKYSAWPERLKYTDFSLLQPPTRAGQFLSEDGRFNSNEKHSLGQQVKQERQRVYENKLRRLAAWNERNQERVLQHDQQTQQRAQANDYLLRLTKETYEQHCHPEAHP